MQANDSEMLVNRTWATATDNRTYYLQHSHCRLPKRVTKKKQHTNPGGNLVLAKHMKLPTFTLNNRAMVNNNNVDDTNIQAIRTPIRSTMSNNCLKCGKSHVFHREACPAFESKCSTRGKANHWASVCLSNGTKSKQRQRSQSREHKKSKSHYQPQYRRKQYVKTDAVYNNKEAEEQMESLTFNYINMTQRDELSYSLTLNCQIEVASTSCVWRSIQGHKGTSYQFLHSVECSQKKMDADGFPNIKKQFINKKW